MLLTYILGAYGVFNLYTFMLMGWDKYLAGKNKMRVPEARFFQLSLFGGSLGVLVAMPVWRHKNRKWTFQRPVYLIAAGQVALLLTIWYMFF